MSVGRVDLQEWSEPDPSAFTVPLDVLPTGMLAVDRRGLASLSNRAWSELTGQSPEAAQGAGWVDAVHREDRTAVVTHVRDVRLHEAAVPRWRLHRADGHVAWTSWGLTDLPVPDKQPRRRLVIVSDVDAEHRAQLALSYAATHDSLTGALSRAALMELLDHALARLRRHPGTVALLFIDLDGFKELNDRHGHAAGDRLLAAQASRIRAVIRPSDSVGRFGGDEFVVVCEDLATLAEAEAIAHRVAVTLAAPFDLDSGRVETTASVGLAVTVDGAMGREALVTSADRAMYRAKRSGGSRVVATTAVVTTTRPVRRSRT